MLKFKAFRQNNIFSITCVVILQQMLLTSEQRHEIIDLKNKDSNTALHIACAQGYEDIAVHLMSKGADVKSRNYNNETPLHLASFYGQNE